MFFSPNLSAFCAFVRLVLVWFCLFPLPLGVWEVLQIVIVAFPGLFFYLYLYYQYAENHTVRAFFVRMFDLCLLVCVSLLYLSGIGCDLFYEAICFRSCLVLFCSCVFQSF